MNLSKAVSIALMAMVLATAALVFSATAYFLKPSGLCDYPSPRQITTTVKGVDGPAVVEHGTITEHATRCVRGNHNINVVAVRSFQKLDDNDSPTSTVVPDLRGDAKDLQARVPGKVSTDVGVALPSEVGPGRWRLSGLDQVPSSGELRTWFSEPFTVVAQPQGP